MSAATPIAMSFANGAWLWALLLVPLGVMAYAASRQRAKRYAVRFPAVTSLRVAGMVHDFLLLDSLRHTKAANVARKLSVDFLRDVLQPRG